MLRGINKCYRKSIVGEAGAAAGGTKVLAALEMGREGHGRSTSCGVAQEGQWPAKPGCAYVGSSRRCPNPAGQVHTPVDLPVPEHFLFLTR